MKKIVLLVGCLTMLLSFVNFVKAENTQAEIDGLAVDASDNIIAVGQLEETKDKYVLVLQKYDGKTGKIEWQSKFGERAMNIGKAVVVDSSGNIYVGGVVGKEVAGVEIPSTDYIIIKYDKNGNRIMYKTYDNGFFDSLMDMGIDEDGFIYVTGISLDVTLKNLTNMDFWTIKIDPTNLNKVKEHIFDRNMDAAFGMDVKKDVIVVTGTVMENNKEKFCLIKYDKDLNVKWIKYYGQKNCSASDAVILPNGDIAVTGDEEDDFLTILYDSNGEIKSGWPRKEENAGRDIPLSITCDSKGNIIVAGYKSVGLKERWCIIKYDKNGNVLWEKLEGVQGEIKRVVVDSEDNIIVSGYRIEGDTTKICIRKYNSNGDFIWEASQEGAVEPTHADFTWLPEEPTRADVVHFYDKSTGEIISWHWDFGDGSTSNERNPVHQYTNIGTYNVTLRIVGKNINDTKVKQITIRNALPSADFTYNPLNPIEGQEITFSADATDKDGEVVNYTWNFGDGSVAYGKVVTHTYSKAGIYNVTLSVKDNDGDVKKVAKRLIVNALGENMPPVAIFEIKTHVGIGEEVEIDASGSYDEDGNIVFYTWDWDGDGKIDDQYTISKAVHTWYKEGEYNVTLIVEDNKGLKSSYTKTIRVGGIPKIIIELPEKIEVKKGKEKTIYIKIICLNKTLYFLNFTVEGNAEITPLATHFNISAGSEKEVPIKVKCTQGGEIKIKAMAKDTEKDIVVESNEESVDVVVKGQVPSFTLILFIIALMAILLRKKWT